jgi:hypothetical protein
MDTKGLEGEQKYFMRFGTKKGKRWDPQNERIRTPERNSPPYFSLLDLYSIRFMLYITVTVRG